MLFLLILILEQHSSLQSFSSFLAMPLRFSLVKLKVDGKAPVFRFLSIAQKSTKSSFRKWAEQSFTCLVTVKSFFRSFFILDIQTYKMWGGLIYKSEDRNIYISTLSVDQIMHLPERVFHPLESHAMIALPLLNCYSNYKHYSRVPCRKTMEEFP